MQPSTMCTSCFTTVLWVALLFTLQAPSALNAKTTIISVGGQMSAAGCDGTAAIGWFLGKRLGATRVAVYTLPDFTQTLAYEEVEVGVVKALLAAFELNEDVVLLGYSHGAELVLRVLKKLSDTGRYTGGLSRVRLVTIDLVDLRYPGDEVPQTVPVGIRAALNVFGREVQDGSHGHRREF